MAAGALVLAIGFAIQTLSDRAVVGAIIISRKVTTNCQLRPITFYNWKLQDACIPGQMPRTLPWILPKTVQPEGE